MATYYVNAQTGSNANDGSLGSPWATLAYAIANSASGDTLLLAGIFRESGATIPATTGRIIRNWTSTPWKMRNTQLITGWTAQVGYYNKTIATGLSAKCLIVDWDTSRTATGQHYGHVQAVSSAASVPGTDNSWNYNSGTGELRVRIGANLDPAGFTVELGLGGAFALIVAHNATGCDISGFDMGPNPDGASGYGYGILMSGTNNVVHDGEMHDCGYHALGFVAQDPAYSLANCFAYNINAYGSWGDGAIGQLSRYVTYIYSGTASGIQWSNCVAYKTLPILRNGTSAMTAPVSGGTAFKSSGGWFWHSQSGTIGDLTHFRCTVYNYTDGKTVAGGLDFCGQDSTTPSSYTNPNTYGVRNIECRVIAGEANQAPNAAGCSQAFIRCRLDYSGIASLGTSTAQRCGFINTGTGTSTWGHFACDIKTNLNASTDRAFFGVTAANRLAFVNCSILEFGSTSNVNVRVLFNWSGTPTVGIYARNTVFAFATLANFRVLNFNDNAQAAAIHDFLGCAYRNITAGYYSTNTGAGINTQSGWTSLVDTQASILAVDPYTDMSGASSLILVPSVGSIVRPWQPNVTVGVNNVTLGRQLGSWGTLYEPGIGRSSGGREARVGRVVRI